MWCGGFLCCCRCSDVRRCLPIAHSFQTSRSGRLVLHTDIRMLVARHTDSDTAAAHAKGLLEAPSDLKLVVVQPDGPKYSPRLD